MTLRLAFAGPLVYTRNEGFRTADLSFPFRALGSPKGGDNPGWWARCPPQIRLKGMFYRE